jgi:hypothetical protein
MDWITYIKENSSWIFSGIGVLAISGIVAVIRYRSNKASNHQTQTVSGRGRGYQAGGDINYNEKKEND